MQTESSFLNHTKWVSTGVSVLRGSFGTLSNLNMLLQGKNTNRINDCNVIHSFIVILVLWHYQVEKKSASVIPNLKIALEKNHIKLKVKLDAEVKPHFRILK